MNIEPISFLVLCASFTLKSFYFLSIKKFSKNLMLLLFWVNLFSYLFFSSAFFLKHRMLYLFNYKEIETLFFDFTYTNFPLFALAAFFTLAAMIMLEHLNKKFEISTIIAIAKINILSSSIGYFLLGNSITVSAVISIITVCLGALISGMPHFDLKNPLKPFLKLNGTLIKGSVLYALCSSAIAMITFICTAHYNEHTRFILRELAIHTHVIPFNYQSPVHFNIGLQFAVITTLFIYIKFYKKQTKELMLMVIQRPLEVGQAALFYTIASYCYYVAFNLIDDKTLLTAIFKMYIPITLILSHHFLGEKITQPKAVGAALIVIGSSMAVLL